MNSINFNKNEKGQAFPEYAMLLVFISLVVVIGSALFGQKIGAVYAKVTDGLTGQVSVAAPGNGEGEGNSHYTVSSQSVAREGHGNGNSLDLTFNTSGDMKVTVADSQSGKTETVSCNGACSVHFASVGKDSGTLTLTTEFGDRLTLPYPAKN